MNKKNQTIASILKAYRLSELNFFVYVKSCQVIESILKYENGFKDNLMHKEIFN